MEKKQSTPNCESDAIKWGIVEWDNEYFFTGSAKRIKQINGGDVKQFNKSFYSLYWGAIRHRKSKLLTNKTK